MIQILVNIYYNPIFDLCKFINDNLDLFFPINGGSGLRNAQNIGINLNFDDVGENISSKNALLNEMTSIYWFWKNKPMNPSDYVGFNHYRRFFSRNDISDYQTHDLIVAQPIRCPFSLAWQYNYYHCISDLQKCADVLKTHDHEFQSKFVDYINKNTDNFAPCNMFVMTWKLFDGWCNFIFPILFDLEKAIDVAGRDNYQKRALCFLTERIFGFWCYDKMISGLKVKQIPMIEHKEWKDNTLNERGTY